MASLLAKFRIDYHDVTVIPDVTRKAKDETKSEFLEIAARAKIGDEELASHKEKTNRHLRLAESLREYSSDSEMVVMWVYFDNSMIWDDFVVSANTIYFYDLIALLIAYLEFQTIPVSNLFV